MEDEQNERKSGLNLGTLALGVIAGAVAGVLLSPKSGKENREALSDNLHKIKDTLAEKLSQAGEVTKEVYDDIVGEVVRGYKEAQDITEDEANEVEQDLKEGFGKLKEEFSKEEEPTN